MISDLLSGSLAISALPFYAVKRHGCHWPEHSRPGFAFKRTVSPTSRREPFQLALPNFNNARPRNSNKVEQHLTMATKLRWIWFLGGFLNRRQTISGNAGTVMRTIRSILVALAGGGLIFLLPASGQAATNRFSFNDYVVAAVRVHLLSAKGSPAIYTALTEKDIARILGKL